MKQDAGIKRCPRCGSKQLHKESSPNRSVSVVICQDCDAVFELHSQKGHQHQRTLKEDDSNIDERKWHDYVEDDDEILDEEADETGFEDDYSMEDDDVSDEEDDE